MADLPTTVWWVGSSVAAAIAMLLAFPPRRSLRRLDRTPPDVAAHGSVGRAGWRLRPRAPRADLRAVRDTPLMLDLLAACLAAGLPSRAACRTVAAAFDSPLSADLNRVVALTELGASDADAWRSLMDHPQLAPAAADLARCLESGTRLAETLRSHAAGARDRQREAAMVRARAVGVRSVLPMMTCFIPAFILLGVLPTVASALAQAFGV